MSPKIFVGSSTEGKPLADRVVTQLSARGLEPMPWFDFFKTGRPPLQELERITLDAQGAILVGSADDRASIRNREQTQMRDNVLFEYGLFSGHIGRSKCALLLPDEDDFRIPSDLFGLACLELYRQDNFDDSSAAAVAKLGTAIRQGFRPEDVVTKAKRLLLLVAWVREGVVKSISGFYEAPSRALFARKLEGLSEFVREDIDQLQLRQQYDDLIKCITDATDSLPGLPTFDQEDPDLREALRALSPHINERDGAVYGGVAPHGRVLRALAEQYARTFGFLTEAPRACRFCEAYSQARRWAERTSGRSRDEEERVCLFRGVLRSYPPRDSYALRPDSYAEWQQWAEYTRWYDQWHDAPRRTGCAFFPWSEGVAQAATVFESYLQRRIKSETQKFRDWSEYHFGKINASIEFFEKGLHETLFGKL